MAFMNFGNDPTMANATAQIGKQIIDVMLRNGSIQPDVANWLSNQLNLNFNVIIGAIQQSAQQNNSPVTDQIIQGVLQQWIQNLLQQYATQAQMRAMNYNPGINGYNPGYVNYAQPPSFGTVYGNPNYTNPNVITAGIGNGMAAEGYNTYATQQQTSTQTANANRFSSSVKPNPPESVKESQKNNVSYSGLNEFESKDVSTTDFKGVRKLYRIEMGKYAVVVYGIVSGVRTSMTEVIKCIKPQLGNGKYFARVVTNMPKVIDAPLNKVSALLAKYKPVIEAQMASQLNSMAVQNAFYKFHVEFMQEKSEEAKAIEKFIVSEFNELAATNCLFGSEGGHLKIDSMEDIVELYNKDTKDANIKKWQGTSNYWAVLGNLVVRAVFAVFTQNCGYRQLAMGNAEDSKIIAEIFRYDNVEGMTFMDGFFALNKAIDAKHIEDSDKCKALFNYLRNRTVFAVPRTLIFSNINPGMYITGDYSAPMNCRVFTSPTNDLEFCIAVSHKAMNPDNAPSGTEMYLDYGSVRYRMTYGVTTDSAFITSMRK